MEELPAELMEVLVCPSCRTKFAWDYESNELACTSCRLIYPVRDGIPILLVDQARQD